MKTLVYLACPYSDKSSYVREDRFRAVNKFAAKLMGQGIHVFSSISHSHPIAEAGDLPLGWEFWKDYDTAILSACSKMIVLMLDGWTESKGVSAEIVLAKEMGIPVEFMEAAP